MLWCPNGGALGCHIQSLLQTFAWYYFCMNKKHTQNGFAFPSERKGLDFSSQSTFPQPSGRPGLVFGSVRCSGGAHLAWVRAFAQKAQAYASVKSVMGNVFSICLLWL